MYRYLLFKQTSKVFLCIPNALSPGLDVLSVVRAGGKSSYSLEDGREVQMQVPPGAAPGSLMQFEPPPQQGTYLDAKPEPAASSIEMRSNQPEVRLNVDTMSSIHGRKFVEESVNMIIWSIFHNIFGSGLSFCAGAKLVFSNTHDPNSYN